MNEKCSIEDILTLVEQNFDFLHIGMFLSLYIQEHNLATEAKNLSLNLEQKPYLLRGDLIRDSFSNSFINWNKSNILGYFVEWNAFRGIAMAMYEGIKNNDFKNFLKHILKQQYTHFEYIIAFIRNILSHNIDNEIRLSEDDFERSKKRFIEKVDKSGVAVFDFIYSRDFPEKTTFPENYRFKIELKFYSLKEGDKLTDIISEWQLFMIMELCRNIVAYYRKNQFPNNYLLTGIEL